MRLEGVREQDALVLQFLPDLEIAGNAGTADLVLHRHDILERGNLRLWQLIDRGPGQDPGLKINQDEATWENLQLRLSDIFKARAEKVMFVKGDDNIPFANVANVIDIAHSAGVDKVGLITAKIEAGN